MNSLVAIQHWLYSGIARELGHVAGGDALAIFAAMATAILFGAVHALMPGHGKTVLVSYHLGQPAKLGLPINRLSPRFIAGRNGPCLGGVLQMNIVTSCGEKKVEISHTGNFAVEAEFLRGPA